MGSQRVGHDRAQRRKRRQIHLYIYIKQRGNQVLAYIRDQIANICWIIKKAREFQKNMYFCFTDYAKAFDCVDHNKLENSGRDGNTRPPDLPLRNLYASQEVTVTIGHGTDWFQIGQGVHQGCILSPCLFNLYAGYIMRNAGMN